MKKIKVPDPIMIKTRKNLKEENVGESKFSVWAENIIDYYSEGVKTLKQVRQVQKIVDALRSANGSFNLEDAEWDLLKASVEAYPTKMLPIVVRQHLPFIEAILEAEDIAK